MEGMRETGNTVRANQRMQIQWIQVNWAHIKSRVEKSQQLIFRDAQTGNWHSVKQRQKLLVRSLSARLLAVRLVCEINDGKNTPGIDGVICIKGEQKVALAESLKFIKYRPDPVKTTWIPKPNGDLRRLGIPTMKDRAMQMLVLLAMNPQWEAKFELHSFGFRPGKSAIDAVHHISNTLMHRKGYKVHPGWILDADISKCFDTIDHEALLRKIGDSPFKEEIRAWLKSGAISSVGFEETKKGTPQGGVISPLLANIALDGLERQFAIYSKNGNYLRPSKRAGLNKDVAVFRYADDFIVLAPSKEILEQYVISKVRSFLATVGLSLNDAKTRVVNISEGVEFLGFCFRRFYRRNGEIKKFTFYPSRARLDRFMDKLTEYVKLTWNKDVREIIAGMNRRIVGVCNYFRWSDAHDAFSYLDTRIVDLVLRWARYRHKGRGKRWLVNRYFRQVGNRKWVFSYLGIDLILPSQLRVLKWWKWPKVRIDASPFNPDQVDYWCQRRKKAGYRMEGFDNDLSRL